MAYTALLAVLKDLAALDSTTASQAGLGACAGTYGDQLAALKLLILDEDTAHAILNEVRLCLKLSHKNLVQLLDCAVVATKKQPSTPGCQVRAGPLGVAAGVAPWRVSTQQSAIAAVATYAWFCWLVCFSGCESALEACLWMAYPPSPFFASVGTPSSHMCC